MIPASLVVLAGGQGQRLGGRDKAQLLAGRHTLLQQLVLRFGPHVMQTVVVRRREQTLLEGAWETVFDQGLGPVAAVECALPQVRSPWLLLAAVDHPFATVELLAELVDGLGAQSHERRDGVMLHSNGRAQPFFGIYRSDALRQLMPQRGLCRWLQQLHLREVALQAPWNQGFDDVDEPQDLGILPTEGLAANR